MNYKLLLFVGFNLLVLQVVAQPIINGCSQLKSFQNKVGSTDSFARNSTETEIGDFDINYVKIDLKADNTSTYLEGSVIIKSTSLITDLSIINLDLVDPFSVDSILIKGIRQTFDHSNELLSINISPILNENEVFEVQIFYHGNPASGGFFSGIAHDVSNNWGNEVTWTLSEPLNAKQWWPSKQVLEDKIDSSDVFITVPNHLKVGSNGLLKQVTSIDGNTDRYEWESRYPIAYYLISFVVAEFDEYNVYAFEGTENELLVQNYLYNNPNVLPTFKTVIDQVPSMIELYSELYGMYPFLNEKYGHTMAELGGGAMEHQTMTTMTDFPFNTTAHELAHQWFGNQVTCGTWQDIWVNEGFASYSEYLANEFLKSPNDAKNWLNEAHNLAFQRPTGSIYIPIELAEDEGTIFNYRLTYKKGGSIIHMIRKELNNDEQFFAIMKAYQNQYKYSNAVGLDFKSVVEQESQMDFTNFFDQWYFGEGFPTEKFEWTYEQDSFKLSSVQTTSSAKTPFFNLALDVNLSFEEGDSTVRFLITDKEQEFKIFLPKEVVAISIDPNKDLLMKTARVTYIKPKEPEVVLALDNLESTPISIYPNPSNGNVLITYSNNIKVVSFNIINATGSNFNKYVTPNGSNKLLLQGLLPGIYIVEIFTESQRFTQKLIIEK